MKRHYTALALILVCVLLAAGCELLPKEVIDEPPPLLKPPEARTITYEVERGYIAEEITGLARVAAVREEQLYFTESGRLDELNVEYNEAVKKGELLAKLNIGDLEFQYKLAKLSHQQKEIEHEKVKPWVGKPGGMNRFDYQVFLLDLEKSRLNLERLKARMDGSTIYAPFDGRITSIRAQIGKTVGEYDTVLVIADPTDLQLVMQVNDRELQKLTTGLPVKIKLLSGEWVDGEVVSVPAFGDVLPDGQPDRRVIILPKDPGLKLEFDDLMQVAIVVQEKHDALIIPKAALRRYMGRSFVRVKEGDARREVDVETGIESSTHVEIVKGLEEGQIIIGK